MSRPAGVPLVANETLCTKVPGGQVAVACLVSVASVGVGSGLRAVGEAGLHINLSGHGAVIERLPGRAAYPAWLTSYRLFTLKPGQIGRYRANFRLTGCACAPQWYYESWTVHVAFASARPDLFLNGVADRELDQRVHLCGGPARRSSSQRST